MLAAVDVGSEGDPFIIDATQGRQAEDLIPSAVRQDRLVPSHKTVQAPHLLDYAYTGLKIQVVRVRQKHAEAEPVDLLGREGLYGGLTRDWAEHGSSDQAVGSRKLTSAGAKVKLLQAETVPCHISKQPVV